VSARERTVDYLLTLVPHANSVLTDAQRRRLPLQISNISIGECSSSCDRRHWATAVRSRADAGGMTSQAPYGDARCWGPSCHAASVVTAVTITARARLWVVPAVIRYRHARPVKCEVTTT
jgi:hypothetical protein